MAQKKQKVKKAALGMLVFLMAIGILQFQFSGKLIETPAVASSELTAVPVQGLVTMVDLGAKECIPCKMMIPVMEKVEKKYKGKAAIIFIDVWKNREPARRFGIRGIPTQIFFDKEGKEIFRHVGFMSEAEIDRVFSKMGVN